MKKITFAFQYYAGCFLVLIFILWTVKRNDLKFGLLNHRNLWQ